MNIFCSKSFLGHRLYVLKTDPTRLILPWARESETGYFPVWYRIYQLKVRVSLSTWLMYACIILTNKYKWTLRVISTSLISF